MGAVIEERRPTMAEVRAAVDVALKAVQNADHFGYWDLGAQVVDTGEFDVEILAQTIYRRLAR